MDLGVVLGCLGLVLVLGGGGFGFGDCGGGGGGLKGCLGIFGFEGFEFRFGFISNLGGGWVRI